MDLSIPPEDPLSLLKFFSNLEPSIQWSALNWRPYPKRLNVSTSKSILTISRDEKLQHSRTLLLEHSGYHVSAALNDQAAISFVENNHEIGLVLMCHSVPEASRIILVTRIKQLCPQLPILMLYNGYDPTEAKVDGSLHSLETPKAMLDMIGFMTRDIGSKEPL